MTAPKLTTDQAVAHLESWLKITANREALGATGIAAYKQIRDDALRNRHNIPQDSAVAMNRD